MSLKKDNGDLLFFRESVYKVGCLVMDNPSRTFHIRGLEKETGFSTTAVIKAVEELSKGDLVLVDKTSLTTNVRANIESSSYKRYKLMLNLYRIEKENLVKGLVELFNRPKAIVLFGSYSKGEDNEQSDIDILVLSSNKQEVKKFLAKKEKKFNRKINLIVLDSLDKSEKEFKNAIANGIVLDGYLKVV